MLSASDSPSSYRAATKTQKIFIKGIKKTFLKLLTTFQIMLCLRIFILKEQSLAFIKDAVSNAQQTSLSLFTFMHWRKKWQPTPVFLPGESQGRGSLVGCHLWGRTQSDGKQLSSSSSKSVCLLKRNVTQKQDVTQ